MSWEKDFERKYPCPCGKGEYLVIYESDDWNRSRTEHEMLCPDCKEKYEYSEQQLGYKPHHTVDRGWVLKSPTK